MCSATTPTFCVLVINYKMIFSAPFALAMVAATSSVFALRLGLIKATMYFID
jgi:hypothetical protein